MTRPDGLCGTHHEQGCMKNMWNARCKTAAHKQGPLDERAFRQGAAHGPWGGMNGFLAETPEQWAAALQTRDPGERCQFAPAHGAGRGGARWSSSFACR